MSGAAGGGPDPTEFGFFTGGTEGNVLGWNNISVVPEPATLSIMPTSCPRLRCHRRHAHVDQAPARGGRIASGYSSS